MLQIGSRYAAGMAVAYWGPSFLNMVPRFINLEIAFRISWLIWAKAALPIAFFRPINGTAMNFQIAFKSYFFAHRRFGFSQW